MFWKLPVELQIHTISFFHLSELSKVLQITKSFDPRFKKHFLNEKIKKWIEIAKTSIETQTFSPKYYLNLEYLLQNRDLGDFPDLKNAFLDQLLASIVSYAKTLDAKKSSEIFQKINLVIWKHGSDEQLTKFIQDIACKFNFKLHEDDELIYPIFAKSFFEGLSQEQILRLSRLNNIMDSVIPSLNSCKLATENTFLLIRVFYQKYPDSNWWVRIMAKNSKGEYKYFFLIKYLIAVQVLEIFAAFKNKESSKELFSDEISKILSVDPSLQFRSPIISARLIRDHLESPQAWQIETFTTAVMNTDILHESVFYEMMLESADPLIFQSTLKGFLTTNFKFKPHRLCFSLCALLRRVISCIKTKIQAAAYIQECLLIEEPLRHNLLQAFAGGFGDNYIKPSDELLEASFGEAGLDLAQYSIPCSEDNLLPPEHMAKRF